MIIEHCNSLYFEEGPTASLSELFILGDHVRKFENTARFCLTMLALAFCTAGIANTALAQLGQLPKAAGMQSF